MELVSIIDFSLSFRRIKSFYKILQERTGYSDAMINKIQKAIPDSITCKIERWIKDLTREDYFLRRKCWIFEENKQEYYETEDLSYDFNPYYIWTLEFRDLFSESENQNAKKDVLDCPGINFIFSLHNREFILYLKGHKFEKNKYPGVPGIPIEEELLDEAILFRLNPHNFQTLDKYHLSNFEDATAPLFSGAYYRPKDYYRRYSNKYSDNHELQKTGVFLI